MCILQVVEDGPQKSTLHHVDLLLAQFYIVIEFVGSMNYLKKLGYESKPKKFNSVVFCCRALCDNNIIIAD